MCKAHCSPDAFCYEPKTSRGKAETNPPTNSTPNSEHRTRGTRTPQPQLSAFSFQQGWNNFLLSWGPALHISSKTLLVWQLETGLEPHTSKEVGFGTHPIHGAEVHSFSKIKALIEAAVISSWKGDHKLSSTLIGPINLGENRYHQVKAEQN